MKNAPMKVLIKSSYQDLSKKERAIADFILKNPKKVSRMTLNEIAQELDIATSTVFQFTRKLGYSGFRDFRNDLLAEEFDPTISIHENVSSTDSSLGVAQKVFASSIKSLKETSNLLVEDTLDQAIELLIHADVVTFLVSVDQMWLHLMPIISFCTHRSIASMGQTFIFSLCKQHCLALIAAP